MKRNYLLALVLMFSPITAVADSSELDSFKRAIRAK